MAFHDVRFPTRISRGATGGPERRTDIVAMGSGREERNARWAHARRRYNAGTGIRTLDDLHEIIAFFEERRGRLYGFRWKDHGDYKSCLPGSEISNQDQLLGVGDGVNQAFQLVKAYGSASTQYLRAISKPVSESVTVAVDGYDMTSGTDFTLDPSTGVITFDSGVIPASDAVVTAGFLFDVPVRFDSDILEVSISSFEHGAIPNIPIVEVRL